MTDQVVHIFIGDKRSVFASSLSRNEAEERAREAHPKPTDENERKRHRPTMAMYTWTADPDTISALGDLATLSADTVYDLMEAGRLKDHAGVTL